MTEKTTRSVGYLPGYGVQVFFSSNDGKPQVYREPNEVSIIPIGEREEIIYRLFEENCDLIFCKDETSKDFKFIALEHFVIFAVDSKGNCFGTIGGIGDIEDEEFPVGCVTKNGKCGKIASTFKEFLVLVNYYPYWREIVEFESKQCAYSVESLKEDYKMDSEKYIENQKQISNILNFKKNENSIHLLLSNLRSEDQFVVFNRRYENLL